MGCVDAKGTAMICLNDLILSFDFESIHFDAQDDLIDESNTDYDKWFQLVEQNDNFVTSSSLQLKESSAYNVNGIESLTYDHVWLMQRIDRHLSEFMQASGLETKQLALSILEILRFGGHGILYI
jgi:hypothetical protein